MKKIFFYTTLIMSLYLAYHIMKSKRHLFSHGFYMVFKQTNDREMLLISGENPASTTGMALSVDNSHLENVIITDLRKQSMHIFFDSKGNFKGAGLYLINELGEEISLLDETLSGSWKPITKSNQSK